MYVTITYTTAIFEEVLVPSEDDEDDGDKDDTDIEE